MATPRKVLVVGGGIGGLAGAIALRQARIDVDLIEINREWTAEHVGMMVQANAVRALAALGVATDCAMLGYAYEGIELRDIEGNLLSDLHGVRLAGPGYPTDFGISGQALHDALKLAAIAAGAKIRLGVDFTSISECRGSVSVRFGDGTSGDYDLLVGADGRKSKVRAELFGSRFSPEDIGQGAWCCTIDRCAEMDRAVIFAGLPSGRCGFFPISPVKGCLFLIQEQPASVPAAAHEVIRQMRERLAGCTGTIAKLCERILESQAAVYHPLNAFFMPRPWYRGRAVLIGDAVHTMPPHMAQGAAQAIEDAVVLANVLRRSDLQTELLEDFVTRRFERCKRAFEVSLQVAHWERRPVSRINPAWAGASLIAALAEPI